MSRATRIEVVLLILATALIASGLVAAGEPHAKRAVASTRPALSGIVTAQRVGAIHFGATTAQVRAWAGPAEFASPPLKSYPVPAHPRGTLVIGYHCGGFDHHVCHTLFGFRNGRLTTFTTESRLFMTASGVRPSMKVEEALRLHPGLRVLKECPSWAGKAIPTLAVTTEQQGRVFDLFASGGPGKAVFGPHC